jgi:hypothetical protein
LVALKRFAVAWCAALALLLGIALPTAAAPTESKPVRPVPVLAYYYQWFTPASWDRAKVDYPLAGRYSSDDVGIMQEHVDTAKAAGIDGFIVSWKSSRTNNRRLEALIKVARAADFKLVLIYQGLDFSRRPLPVSRVAADFKLFARRYAPDPVFGLFSKPMLIWSGTWEYSVDDIERVTELVRGSVLTLATEKSPAGYERVASSFDGNAYYWSSVDPKLNSGYAARLAEMAATVHAAGGLWIAPFAPGFDARMVGGSREVPRRDGDTLQREYQAAVSSTPDALGLISWNEFSENTHVEPSERYGDSALTLLTSLERGPTVDVAPLAAGSDTQGGGVMTVQVSLLVLLLLAIALPIYAHLRQPPAPQPRRRAERAGSPVGRWNSRGGRIRVAIIAAGLALASLVASGAVRAAADRDAGTTPLYAGAQRVADSKSVLIAAAGDISCPPGRERHDPEFKKARSCRMEDTAGLVRTIQPDAVLALGDAQYPSGSLSDFQSMYDNNWGTFRDITFPVPGNHEYGTPAARGYYSYFGARAGEADKGYYSYDLGAWHVIALNSECEHVGGCGAAAPQATWLRQDLANHPRRCVLAYWHRPRFSSGSHGNNLDLDAYWRILVEGHADLVLNGHDHDYERFAPMNAEGDADNAKGLTEIVAGTGGASYYNFHLPESTSVARVPDKSGVLRLGLQPTSFSWDFLAAPGGEPLDAGTTSCH